MNSIVRFEYLYRDADNYKKYGELFFNNPLDQSMNSLERHITSLLIDQVWFVAHQINIPNLFLFDSFKPNDADHCYHEFVSVQTQTKGLELDSTEGSIDELITRIENASTNGWIVQPKNFYR